MVKTTAENLFTPDERERIRVAVAAVERTTAGEVATMMVNASDSYREAEHLGALFLSGFAALLVAVATHHVTIWSYLPLVLLLYFPCVVLLRRIPRLLLPFVGRRRLAEAVRERAVRAFFEKGLYRTREETGILIFISLLERKVWILGDRGIDRKIPPETWERFVTELTAGLRAGRAADALCSVIAGCGRLLAEHFPRRADDVNELPDTVLTESRPTP
jgi:putative membrane protein